MAQQQNEQLTEFLDNRVSKVLIHTAVILALVYTALIAFWFERGNIYLYSLIVAGQLYYLYQLLSFLHTIWDTEQQTAKPSMVHTPPVDVFITVAGEPVDIVEQTVVAAKLMPYPNFNIYILNDGYVAKKENWKDIEELALKHKVSCITRKIPGGAKAGNINNALSLTTSPLVAIFDADHVPEPDFLKKTAGYFVDPHVAFVQTPQFYKNSELNSVTSGAWNQQELWFGAILKGKNRLNSASMCGTNMVIRRKALNEVGGMCTESIAEDFVTGLFMHAKGWKSIYIPEVLAKGLAPEDFLSYVQQQFRWARGALDVIFRYNLLFRKGLSLAQRLQYLASASYFVSGLVVIMYALVPVIFLFTGEVPFTISTMLLAAVFIPYMIVTLYILARTSNFTFTFRSLAFSMAGFNIHTRALWAAITRTKSSFSVTSKRALEGNFINLVIPHLIYIALVVIGIPVALLREGLSPSVVTNLAWAFLNIAIFLEFIRAALPNRIRALKTKTQLTHAT